jgi:hypothetical protein
MKHYLFLDESGDHGLSFIDSQNPVFLLCGILISTNENDFINQTIDKIKRKFWETDAIIFHSRDIRKCSNEFKILLDQKLKTKFHISLNTLMKDSKFYVIPSAIDKNKYIHQSGFKSVDIYELCLSAIFEKSIHIVNKTTRASYKLDIIIERRGKREDRKLRSHLDHILLNGTSKIPQSIIGKFEVVVTFKSKKENCNGLQLADLIAYPIAKYLINREKKNPAFEIIKDKIHPPLNKILIH